MPDVSTFDVLLLHIFTHKWKRIVRTGGQIGSYGISARWRKHRMERQKGARDLLLHQVLVEGADCMQAVQKFKQDPKVFHTFTKEATVIF